MLVQHDGWVAMATSLSNILILSIFPVLLAVAGIGDFMTMRIPNWLNGAMVVTFFPTALIAGMPLEVMLWHVLAGLLVLAVGMLLFFTIRFGGGDAKMLAAGALWVGWSALIPYIFFTVLTGGVLALLAIIWLSIKIWRFKTGDGWLNKLLSIKADVPYGLAIAGGGILSFSQTWWLLSMV